MIEIRRVFSATLAMLKQGGFMLAGMLVLFAVLQMIFYTVFGEIIGAFMAGAMFALTGMRYPSL